MKPSTAASCAGLWRELPGYGKNGALQITGLSARLARLKRVGVYVAWEPERLGTGRLLNWHDHPIMMVMLAPPMRSSQGSFVFAERLPRPVYNSIEY